MKTVIVDSDALIALINRDDSLSTKAIKTLESLHTQEVRLLYPATTIVETTTALQRKLSNTSLTAEIARMIREGQFPVAPVDQEVLELAESIFKPTGSKQNTLFDAVVAAIAKRLNADAIFGFDSWYEKIGLTLASSTID
ncbi:MAG TPA: type II toxin-antitoxin system VapC family toxin [Candidatus Saccharimonadales bacterium]|jgi:predicted nucleic acid-binding protein